MRQLATIQTISKIEPIPGADSIELAHVKGWQCVVKKGEFKVDDACVFLEIDSLAPEGHPAFEFLSSGNSVRTMNIEGKEYRGYRLRTIRLRGQLSQGLALPISAFPELSERGDFELGEDLSEALGIVKWEAPLAACLSGVARSTFPSFIPKTDEERIQNCAKILEDFEGDDFYVTEKLDGSSMTVFKTATETPNTSEDPNMNNAAVFHELHVCSRNMDLVESEGNTFWKVTKELDLENKIPAGIAVQGELVGEGIQGNPLKLTGQHFYAFGVYIIGAGRYMDYKEMKDFLAEKGIDTVPVIAEDLSLTFDLEGVLKMADGPSRLNPTTKREGLVFRPVKESKYQVPRGMGRLSFKAISNDYLLNES